MKLSADDLMMTASQDFYCLHDCNEWNSKENEQILALQAEVKQLKHQNNNGTNCNNTNNNGKCKSNQHNKDTPHKKTRTPEKQAAITEHLKWKNTPPINGVYISTKNGHTYYWCDFHKCWGGHTTKECGTRKKQLQKAAEKVLIAKLEDTDLHDPEEALKPSGNPASTFSDHTEDSSDEDENNQMTQFPCKSVCEISTVQIFNLANNILDH